MCERQICRLERLDLINGKYIEGVLISSIVGIALIFVAGASGLISIDTELLNLLPSLFFGSVNHDVLCQYSQNLYCGSPIQILACYKWEDPRCDA